MPSYLHRKWKPVGEDRIGRCVSEHMATQFGPTEKVTLEFDDGKRADFDPADLAYEHVDARFDDWHGWSNSRVEYDGISIHVGPLPNRKSLCLYTMDYRDGATMYVHAYFRKEEEAKRFTEFLDMMLGIRWR